MLSDGRGSSGKAGGTQRRPRHARRVRRAGAALAAGRSAFAKRSLEAEDLQYLQPNGRRNANHQNRSLKPLLPLCDNCSCVKLFFQIADSTIPSLRAPSDSQPSPLSHPASAADFEHTNICTIIRWLPYALQKRRAKIQVERSSGTEFCVRGCGRSPWARLFGCAHEPREMKYDDAALRLLPLKQLFGVFLLTSCAYARSHHLTRACR